MYNTIVPSLTRLEQVKQDIRYYENALTEAQYDRGQDLEVYQTALIEDVAGNTDANRNVLDTSYLGTAVSTGAESISQLKRELAVMEAERDRLTASITQVAVSYRAAIQEAYDQYVKEMRVYELIVFLVSVILIAPLFYFSWRKYSYSRVSRSEYAIIWGGVVATFGLIMAQIMLVFIYEILPHQLLQFLFNFLSGFAILWTLLYWLAFILVPAFFGFLIYLIQKKFYNQQAVTMRALKSGHCPHCSLKVLPTMNNCPICGYHLKTRCEACNNMSTSGGSFCEVCGNRRNHAAPP